ncbi:MAG: hypothetical protein ABGX20_13850 [Bacillus sp. (in: firmicutes)]
MRIFIFGQYGFETVKAVYFILFCMDSIKKAFQTVDILTAAFTSTY